MSVIVLGHDHLDLVLTPLQRRGGDTSRLTFVGRELLREMYGRSQHALGAKPTPEQMDDVRSYVFRPVTEDVEPLRVLAGARLLRYQLGGGRDDDLVTTLVDEITAAAIDLAIGDDLDGGEWERDPGVVRVDLAALAGAKRSEAFDF